jgi:RNA 2'-O ribose methyltransferase substrate binding
VGLTTPTMTPAFGLACPALAAVPRRLCRARFFRRPAQLASCVARPSTTESRSHWDDASDDGTRQVLLNESRTVRSLQNPRVKTARALLKRRARSKDSRMLVEGHRLVLDAVAAGLRPELLFYTAAALERGEQGRRLQNVIEALTGQVVDVPILVTPEVIEYISDTVSPQGVVAVLPQPSLPFPDTSSLVRLPAARATH